MFQPAHHDGAAYDPLRPDGGILYAADRACWEAIRTALRLA